MRSVTFWYGSFPQAQGVQGQSSWGVIPTGENCRPPPRKGRGESHGTTAQKNSKNGLTGRFPLRVGPAKPCRKRRQPPPLRARIKNVYAEISDQSPKLAALAFIRTQYRRRRRPPDQDAAYRVGRSLGDGPGHRCSLWGCLSARHQFTVTVSNKPTC